MKKIKFKECTNTITAGVIYNITYHYSEEGLQRQETVLTTNSINLLQANLTIKNSKVRANFFADSKNVIKNRHRFKNSLINEVINCQA